MTGRRNRTAGALAIIISVATGCGAASGPVSSAAGGAGGAGIATAGTGQTVAFRPVYCELPFTRDVQVGAPTGLSATSCASPTVNMAPDTPRSVDTAGATVLLVNLDQNTRFVLGPADLTGPDLQGSWAELYGSAGGYETVIDFTTAGQAKIDAVARARATATAGSPASEEAIDVNGQVVSFAVFQQAADGGCVTIVGPKHRPLGHDEAYNLAAEIQAAAHLPAGAAPGACSGSAAPFGLAGSEKGTDHSAGRFWIRT